MVQNRDKPPWWLFWPTPIAIGLVPLWTFLAAVALFVILVPLIRWLR